MPEGRAAEVVRGIKPPLKWAGGKRWLLPHIRPLWEPYRRRRLVEPLSGGLAVTLGLMPKRALLNDINPHAINFYRWVKKGLKISIATENDRVLYYRHRERFNQLATNGGRSTKEAAQLFYYLNRTGYNGLCRFNSRGEFNVPFGRYKQIGYVYDFAHYLDAFRNWEFTVGDFQQVACEHGDFIYADPPYDVEFTQYSKEPFGWEDQVRLAEWLAKHKGPVVLSNQATARVKRLYRKLGFRLKVLSAPRLISCTGDRTRVEEVLALKGFQS